MAPKVIPEPLFGPEDCGRMEVPEDRTTTAQRMLRPGTRLQSIEASITEQGSLYGAVD